MIDVVPPARWDFPYDGPGIVLELPRAKVNAVCRVLGVDEKPSRQVWGCAMWANGGCLIILPRIDDIVSVADQAAIRRHEEAHCNGMGKDHL
jgi:hypothetical protein